MAPIPHLHHLAGGSSIAIRTAYAELDPFWTSTARFGLSALALWALVFYRRLPLPRGRALVGVVLYGTLTVGLAFTLISWGLVATPASRAQILMATVPLLTLFLSSLHGIESITLRGVAGSLLAVAGIAITVGGAGRAELSLPHMGAILLASAVMAQGGVVIKRFPPNPPLVTNAISLTVGGLMLGSMSLISGETWAVPARPVTWVALLYLIVCVTIIAFLLYLFVLSKWSASGTSYGFVLMPLVTIVAAAALAGEAITWNFLAGAALVLIGVLVGALLPSKQKPAALEECRDRSGQVLPRCV